MAVSDKVIYLIWLFYYSRHMPYLQRAGIDPQDKNASRIIVEQGMQEFCVYPDVTHVPASYVIFVETRGPVPDAARGGADTLMDDCLREQNMDYDDCRNLGELAPPKVRFLKKGAFEGYKAALQEKGREIGQYKPVRLLDTEERIRYFLGEAVD